MEYIIQIFISLIIATILKSLIRYFKARKYLIVYKDAEINKKKEKKIDVIIPVYNEVKNIKKSIEYFKKISEFCNVYYVTTSKEKSKATFQEVKKQIEEQKTDNIFLDNCPNEEGTMANQLNYMAKKLPKDSLIAIYNIDSFPDVRSFKYVINNIKDNEVYQQVSYFDNNNKGILKSAQNWQNRWSIIYEMGKYLSYKSYSFVYTIGHGLFIHKDVLDRYGYWSKEEINEDNELGFRLLCNNIKIKPIPFLEQADFANTLSIYIKQQSTWVNGPLYAFSYYKKAKRKDIKAFILAVLNFKAFISWTFFPFLFLIFTFISLFYSYIYTILIICLITIYISLFNHIVNRLLIKMNYIHNKKATINLVCDLGFFIIHSFGGIITLTKILRGKNTKKNKYNTRKLRNSKTI